MIYIYIITQTFTLFKIFIIINNSSFFKKIYINFKFQIEGANNSDINTKTIDKSTSMSDIYPGVIGIGIIMISIIRILNTNIVISATVQGYINNKNSVIPYYTN